MKSMPGNAGNVKMKGKKHKLMSCGCCVCSDFRQEYDVKLMMEDIVSYNALDVEDEVYKLWDELAEKKGPGEESSRKKF